MHLFDDFDRLWVQVAEDEVTKWKRAIDAIVQFTDDGVEFWSARDLMEVAGYDKWQNFEKIIQQGIKNAESFVTDAFDHFTKSGKMVGLGDGATREIKDYQVSRQGCRWIFFNCDGSKPSVKAAQLYFNVKIEWAEQVESGNVSPDIPSTSTEFLDSKMKGLSEELRSHTNQLSEQLSVRAKKAEIDKRELTAEIERHSFTSTSRPIDYDRWWCKFIRDKYEGLCPVNQDVLIVDENYTKTSHAVMAQLGTKKQRSIVDYCLVSIDAQRTGQTPNSPEKRLFWRKETTEVITRFYCWYRQQGGHQQTLAL